MVFGLLCVVCINKSVSYLLDIDLQLIYRMTTVAETQILNGALKSESSVADTALDSQPPAKKMRTEEVRVFLLVL